MPILLFTTVGFKRNTTCPSKGMIDQSNDETGWAIKLPSVIFAYVHLVVRQETQCKGEMSK